MFASVEEMNYR